MKKYHYHSNIEDDFLESLISIPQQVFSTDISQITSFSHLITFLSNYTTLEFDDELINKYQKYDLIYYLLSEKKTGKSKGINNHDSFLDFDFIDQNTIKSWSEKNQNTKEYKINSNSTFCWSQITELNEKTNTIIIADQYCLNETIGYKSFVQSFNNPIRYLSTIESNFNHSKFNLFSFLDEILSKQLENKNSEYIELIIISGFDYNYKYNGTFNSYNCMSDWQVEIDSFMKNKYQKLNINLSLINDKSKNIHDRMVILDSFYLSLGNSFNFLLKNNQAGDTLIKGLGTTVDSKPHTLINDDIRFNFVIHEFLKKIISLINTNPQYFEIKSTIHKSFSDLFNSSKLLKYSNAY
ncbi:hypothetical protein EI427_01190 [Flammeovirga pectinis]|uniref:Uncharacterized protein n=1 Tax=Flammeovirga pectinis TaxID=2494373 RepID=A0A3Q9FMZ2_9BACT|nr:hypothetical protein [Flammeovirga pectinis]AZQ60873.1 hypothetical protein EI427_01190 [Flammeovirga pectinis]